MDLTVDEDGYNSSTGSVDEDAELELSCALHDLAVRVKTFEANMQGRFRQGVDDEVDEEEITEDFDHHEEDTDSGHHRMDSDSASPKRRTSRRKRASGFKMAKRPQHDDEDEEYEDMESDEEDRPEGKGGSGETEDEEWDSQEEKEELCELKHNIAKLLQSMQDEAKALDCNQADSKAAE